MSSSSLDSDANRSRKFHAFRAEAVAEFGLAVVADIDLDLLPVSAIIPDILAAGANGRDEAQGLDLLTLPGLRKAAARSPWNGTPAPGSDFV